MKITSLVTLLFITSIHASAQTVEGNFVSAGQEVSTGSYTIQWAIGDLITETFTESNVVLRSGLAASVSITTAITPEIPSSVKVFPNPFSETLTLESDGISFDKASFDFIDPVGKSVAVSVLDIQPNSAFFSTKNLQPGVYIITIKGSNNQQRHIKVLHE